MIPHELYEEVFGGWRGARAAYFRPIGNVGDRLIDAGTRQLFRTYGITEGVAQTADVIFWAGGGNMGDLYPVTNKRRVEASALALALGKPFVILPQSWNTFDETRCDQAFVREALSVPYCPGAVMAPDLALAFRPESPLPPRGRGVGYFFRRDKEAVARDRQTGGDPVRGIMRVREYLLLASRFEEIHTDRAHFAAAGMIAKRRVFLYRNSYHKNEGLAAAWAEWGCGWGG